MSGVAEKDQSSTRFEEGDPSEDAANQKTLQETTLEAPEEQSEIQGTTSESHRETSDGQFSPAEEDCIAILGSSSIDSIGVSPGQASPTVSDAIPLDRRYFEVSPGKRPPAERDFVAQLARFIGGVEIPIRPTRPTERDAEATSIEKASQDKTGIEVLEPSLDGKVPLEENIIKARLERQSIPSESGVRIDGPDKVDLVHRLVPDVVDTNLNTPVTKQSPCGGTTSSPAGQDLKKNITVALLKIRTASDKLNTKAQEADGRIETPINERATLHFAEIKALQTKSSAVIKMKTSFSQQTVSAVDGGKASLIQTPYVAERKNVPFTEASLVRARIQITQQVPSTTAGVRCPLTEVQSGVAEMKASHAQAPSTFKGRKDPLTEVSSAATGMNSPITRPTLFRTRSQLTEVPSAAAGMKAPLTRQTSPAVTRKKEPITEVPSAAAGTSTALFQQASSAIPARKVKLTAACLPSWSNITMQQARRGRASGSKAPQTRQASLIRGRKVHNLPEINVQNIRTGLQGRGFQSLFPSETRRPPYRSLMERMYLEAVYGVTEVVDITKEKKKKKKTTKKKKRYRYACDDDDLSDDSWTSSSDEPKSPPKSNRSSPELEFYLEL